MKSGLGDRNNRPRDPELGGLGGVSMKSGLRDRNNDAELLYVRALQYASQ